MFEVLVAQVPPKREFRAAWVATVANLDWPTSNTLSPAAQRAELVSLLDELDLTGITAIVFQIRPECDALYLSPFEPWSFWLTGTQGAAPDPLYDPLTFAVDEAHKRGMEIHAWFNPYRAYRETNTYTTATSHVTKAHPDWVITCPDGYKILDPGLPQVRGHVAGVVADVVRRYDVDGVHMDDYFYPYPEHGFTNEDAATFTAHPRGFTSLGDWRRDNVNLLLAMIHDSLQAIKPHVKFGMSPFGIWRDGVPAGTTGIDAYSAIYCDAMAWLRAGSIDYLTPQLYWRLGGNQDYAKLLTWWADSVHFYGRHFYPGMAPYRINPPFNYSATEHPSQMRLNRGNAYVQGEVFFRANNGLNDNPKGFADSLRRDLYAYPALHPVMAWKDTVPPYPPRGIRYVAQAGGPPAIQWETPHIAPDGDSASRYAVYRFDHTPSEGDLENARNLIAVQSGLSMVPAVNAATPGPLYYAVTALDRNSNESITSSILTITAPPSPVLASPANGATDVPEFVRVVWRAAPLAASYRVQVSTDPTFTSSILVDEVAIPDTFKVLTDINGQTEHFWRVNSANAGGVSPFSTSFAFRAGFPAAVALTAPPDEATDVPVNATLFWTSSAVATSYRVQLSTTADFTAMALDSSGIGDTVLATPSLQSYRNYFWRVKAQNVLGTSPWSPSFSFRTVQVTSIAQGEGIPSEYGLSQNYPNPFNSTTTIEFALPETGRVVLRVYDVLGRERGTLVDREMSAGRYTVQWEASSVPSGVYFCHLAAGSFTAMRRMMVLR